jgi:hypothetical protein
MPEVFLWRVHARQITLLSIVSIAPAIWLEKELEHRVQRVLLGRLDARLWWRLWRWRG